MLYLFIYKTLTEAYYESWKNSSGFGTEQYNTRVTAGYYSIDSGIPNLKIVFINSNYG